MTLEVELSWHIVCGRFEFENMLKNNKIKAYANNNPRHTLFLKMKYPNQSFYQGLWGSEILYYDLEDNWTTGQLGKMWLTDKRSLEISNWIRDNTFI